MQRSSGISANKALGRRELRGFRHDADRLVLAVHGRWRHRRLSHWWPDRIRIRLAGEPDRIPAALFRRAVGSLAARRARHLAETRGGPRTLKARGALRAGRY